MKIKKLHIQNYKSLVDLEIIEPNPFTVFAGPNGAGKSNIFEALEFIHFVQMNYTTVELFFSYKEINNARLPIEKGFQFNYSCLFESFVSAFTYSKFSDGLPGVISTKGGNFGRFNSEEEKQNFIQNIRISKRGYNHEVEQFIENFSRLFIGNKKIVKLFISSDFKLSADAENVVKILKKILYEDKFIREEILEWMRLLVPSFENLDIYTDSVGGTNTIQLYEKGTKKPFTRNLISDGTYNILSLLTSVYQSDQPQFLCIEEPENGLNPYVIKTLVEFFRKQCEEKGHYIWLNTHSQTLVKNLKPEELILVDKVDGATQIKQFPKDYNLHGLELDEAWLSNALGGGVPW